MTGTTPGVAAEGAAIRHGWATRALHMAVAAAVVWQLGVGLVMQGPRGAAPGDALFATHSTVGLVALGVIVLFWLNLMVRRIGTDAGALFPWLSAPRRAAFLADANAQAGALVRLRLPDYAEGLALASGVHGLGLALMTLMAATGAAGRALEPASTAGVFEGLHKALANLAWVYLIAHAGLGVLHHVRGEASLAAMWSLRGRA